MKEILDYTTGKLIYIRNNNPHQQVNWDSKTDDIKAEQNINLDFISYERRESKEKDIIQNIISSGHIFTVNQLHKNVLLNDTDVSKVIYNINLEWAIKVYESFDKKKRVKKEHREYMKKYYPRDEIEEYKKNQEEHLKKYGSLVVMPKQKEE